MKKLTRGFQPGEAGKLQKNKSTNNTNFPGFEKSFRKAVEPVGRDTYHALCKVLADGLPPDDPVGQQLWNADLISRDLSDEEMETIAKIAITIEEQAFKSILRAISSDGVMTEILAIDEKTRIKSLTDHRAASRTEPFEEYLKENPDVSTKEILKVMEEEGVIETADNGDYLVVFECRDKSEWPRVKKASMDSKLSRLRKKLRNA